MMQIKFSERLVVITDASCFIILHKIDALDLLHKLFSTILTQNIVRMISDYEEFEPDG